MAYALTEEPIVLDLCQKRGFFASCRVPYARRMPASTFAIAGCEASKPCPAIRCAAVIAATRRLRVATTPAFEGSIIRIVEGSIIPILAAGVVSRHASAGARQEGPVQHRTGSPARDLDQRCLAASAQADASDA